MKVVYSSAKINIVMVKCTILLTFAHVRCVWRPEWDRVLQLATATRDHSRALVSFQELINTAMKYS